MAAHDRMLGDLRHDPQNSTGGADSAEGMSLFTPEKPEPLTAEQEVFKRQIYEKMNPRRRKFVDRIGYEEWNPFQAPKDPLDIRKDRTQRTLQDLLLEFGRQMNGAAKSDEWRKGARECALGIILQDGKYQGIFDFCLWYHSLLQKEGHIS